MNIRYVIIDLFLVLYSLNSYSQDIKIRPQYVGFKTCNNLILVPYLPKFIGDDDLTARLCYSSNFTHTKNNFVFKGNPKGSIYSMNLQEIKFLDAKS